MFNTDDKGTSCDNAAGGELHHDVKGAYVKEELDIDFNEPSIIDQESSLKNDLNISASNGKEIVFNISEVRSTLDDKLNGYEELPDSKFNIKVLENNLNAIVSYTEFNSARNIQINHDLNSNQLHTEESVKANIFTLEQKSDINKKNELSNEKIQKKRKNRKSKNFQNYFRMHCVRCSTSSKCIGNKSKICFKCKNFMRFQCAKCNTTMNSYSSMYQHVIYKCSNLSAFKCPECVYKTWDRRSFIGHTKRRHGIKKCIKCDKKFRFYSSLQRHQKYECKIKKPKPRQELDYHFKYESESGTFHCTHCKYRSVYKANLRSHVKSKHMPRKCNECEKQCSDYTSLKIHKTSHKKCLSYCLKGESKTYGFHCAHCKYQSNIKGNLVAHIKRIHMPRKCKQCGEQCSDYTSLKIHKISHKTGLSEFHCAHCKYQSIKKRNLVAHIKCMHTPRKCKQCGEECNDYASLIRHKSSHKRPNVKIHCPNCNKSFDKDSNVKMKNCQECSTSLQYKCLKCTTQYDTWHDFNIHNELHCKKVGLINCSMCDYITPVKGLRKHIAEEHTVRTCKKCGVQCKNYSYLKFHQSSECNFKKVTPIFKCSLCDYEASGGSMNTHIKDHHTVRTCKSCKIKFENSVCLKEHRLNGCNSKSLRTESQSIVKCPMCARLITSAKLKSHLATIHTKRICINCQKIFDNYQCLRKHQLNECEFRQLQPLTIDSDDQINLYCSHCLITFKFVDSNKELKCPVCQTELQYECRVCLKLFQRKEYISRHIRNICNKEAKEHCLVSGCDFKAKEKYKIKLHMKKKHSILEVEKSVP